MDERFGRGKTRGQRGQIFRKRPLHATELNSTATVGISVTMTICKRAFNQKRCLPRKSRYSTSIIEYKFDKYIGVKSKALPRPYGRHYIYQGLSSPHAQGDIQ